MQQQRRTKDGKEQPEASRAGGLHNTGHSQGQDKPPQAALDGVRLMCGAEYKGAKRESATAP